MSQKSYPRHPAIDQIVQSNDQSLQKILQTLIQNQSLAILVVSPLNCFILFFRISRLKLVDVHLSNTNNFKL